MTPPLPRALLAALCGLVLPSLTCAQGDTLGLSDGYISLTTANFKASLAKNAQVLVSLKPKGGSFDFLPYDLLSDRAGNGQYHWGDVTFRYRESGTASWTSVDSAASRQPVTSASSSDSAVLAGANIAATLNANTPFAITREWLNVSGDLGLRFTIQNTGSASVELGSLGFPAEFNSIFTGRNSSDMASKCSLSDPYVGMHAGHIRVAPLSGIGAALAVTPLGDTPFEAYRNLDEPYYDATAYGSQTFEGFYEWQVLTTAYAENEWASVTPWNPAHSRVLAAGESVQFGVRFSLSKQGVRGLDAAVKSTGTPVAVGVPGYIVPRDLTAQLLLQSTSAVSSISVSPSGALTLTAQGSPGLYTVTPSSSAWGRVLATVTYADGKTQTIHYYITKPGTDAVADLGTFLTTKQVLTDTSDPFGRVGGIITYDYEAGAIVSQDPRVWISGMSDEGGAGSFLAAAMKQSIQPNAAEIAKLETFVDNVLFKTIQTSDFAVRKSIFYHDTSALPSYPYSSSIDWGNWWSWDKADAYATDRAYDYVHVAATYWALYRAGRAYPGLIKSHTYSWYLSQAYHTVVRAMNPSVGYNNLGLMGETVFGEILKDLNREGLTSEANNFESLMKTRATAWNSQEVPFGSEMSWDSTGQEGVYYWSNYFNFTNSATKTVNSVLGYMPTVPHWGWNGNARRYWDNIYAGKLQRIERQIHHYGSGLNALVLLGAFRTTPSDAYLLRVGYGGTSGPLASINDAGFAAASFHSFPDTLKWDGYSGDYGPNFVGLALGAATYVVQDPVTGLVAYGGILSTTGKTVTVQTRDAARRRVFIGPLGVLVEVDAGIIAQFSYVLSTKTITLSLAQLSGGPTASSAVVWVETTVAGGTKYKVTSSSTPSRRGYAVSLSRTVTIGPA